MGISNDTDNDPLHDDEHLYSRRASAHTLYSTTASSGRSSPTFSRRGSLTTLPPLHTTGSLPRTRTHTLPPRGVSYNGYDDDESASSYRMPQTRATHPAAIPSGPLNFDGIIKQPSRYPYARSHHHHPYAHYSQPHDGGPPPPGHPYYSQKRHSFAALRTTPSRSSLSSNSHNMAAMTASNASMAGNGVEPSLPLVRLPSIDQGLPPFPGDSSGMVSFLVKIPALVLLFLLGCTCEVFSKHGCRSATSFDGPVHLTQHIYLMLTFVPFLRVPAPSTRYDRTVHSVHCEQCRSYLFEGEA